ncbi:hypothetical protein FH609_027115 [Streptomyces sp. 3MP-14]|uniref:Uncharacterized protein n=1 Tax=Streptomyces mimosae TaxID=2586635 RepID=A0A5N6A152_9ACTN|nr:MULTISPECIES: hypothetical protein [Streptomyces]KAB8161400.1 hypothetical protein FH607_025280 [Streptomyces mimosae]KAB8173276.1 hypothetical protein FH609_027115 [Streptomyces sp. 3MP-14]
MEAKGWPIRDPGLEESASPRPGYRHLVVEVRLFGARWGSVKAAEHRLQRKARRHDLALRIVQSVRLTHDSGRWVLYRVIPKDDARAHRAWLGLLRAKLSGHERHVWVPADTTDAEIKAQLARDQFAGHRFSVDEHQIMPPPPASREEASKRTQPASTASVVRQHLAVLLALISGVSGPLVFGVGYIIPVGSGLAGAVLLSLLPRNIHLVRVLAGAALVWGGSAFLAQVTEDTVRDLGLRPIAYLLIGVTITVAMAPGVYHALRASWFIRNGALIASITLPALGVLVFAIGRFIQSSYLDSFGLPRSEVRPHNELWEFLAAAKPLAVGLALCLFVIGSVGWLRYFYAPWRYTLPLVTVFCALYILMAIALASQSASDAAEQAMADFREGHTPPSYLGLHPNMMCVTPTGEGPIPVENGPVPVDRPVLSFGSSGTWIWLWDAHREGGEDTWRAFAVRREDVELVHPSISGPDCGTTRR